LNIYDTSRANNARNILIVDDEEDILLVLHRAFTKAGFNCKTIPNPKLALAAFAPNVYDVILLDVKMPDMSGFELAKAILSKDPSARICFFTAFDAYEHQSNRVSGQVDTTCILKKPISPAALIAHVEKHLLSS
jgi:DNA-binding response OmpR family regulator